MPATSKAQIADVFNTNLSELTSQAMEQAAAIHGQGLRPWNGPTAISDPLDIPKISEGFDRTDVNNNFEALIADATDPGTVGDAISLKCQVDYVAILERAYSARHATPVRLIGMMAGRRTGHGASNGVFQGGVLKYAQDSIVAGADSSNTDDEDDDDDESDDEDEDT